MVDADHIEARAIALELFVRAILANMISARPDPLGDIEEMRDQFHRNLLLLQGAESEERAERITALIRAKVDQNLDEIRNRVLRGIEIEAAAAGGARN
ncbi:hypothetical protein [Bradyrhizobium sp. Bra64]|uniref:hypothetical protein n=1 Tax=Bradyrhizobium sp. Bra64 TaxID=2926009 RepID=UPI002117D88C|nr:hypothetical protein [Bradyrhizobium sp. Bra64]